MAIPAGTVWEYQADADASNGGGCVWESLVSATYKWTASGSGTNEYYCEIAAGGDPSIDDPGSVTTDGTYRLDTEGTAGSLNAGEWDYADNDTLGYSTVYVRLDDGADPDTKNQGFVSKVIGVGIDYSQQTATALALNDAATSGVGVTTVTSATGGFTAAMVGNFFYLASGTNATAGYYEITAYTDTNTVTIDRACDDGVGGVASGALRVGGALDVPDDAHMEALTAGNLVYFEATGTPATFTLGANVSVVNDGSTTAPIKLVGYGTARGDDPSGASRPTIAAAANAFIFDDYWQFRNLIVTTTAAAGFAGDASTFFNNCKATNSSGSSDRPAFRLANGGFSKVIDCEGISTNGEGLDLNQSDYHYIAYSYFHDSNYGIDFIGSSISINVAFCIIDTCTTAGIDCGNGFYSVLTNNSIYNCATGIVSDGCYHMVIMNNSIDSCTTGISNTAFVSSNFADYNNFNGNTTDISLFNKGRNATANAPAYTNAAGGDFSLQAGSSLRSAAFGVRVGVG